MKTANVSPRVLYAGRLLLTTAVIAFYVSFVRNLRGGPPIRYVDLWIWALATVAFWCAVIMPLLVQPGKLVSGIIGRGHRSWQRQRKHSCVTIDGKTQYSRYLPIGKGVLVAPRKGYDADDIERDRLSASDEFNLPLCATIPYEGWFKRLGFRYLYVKNHTLVPIRRPAKTKANDSKQHAIGVCQDGSPLTLDLWSTPLTIVGGTSGAGKSSVLWNIFVPLLGSDVQVNLVDLTGQFERLDGLDELPRVVSLIETLAVETHARQALLKEHGVARIEMLPSDVRPQRILTVIDEAQLLFDTTLASDAAKATDEQRSYAHLQKIITNLISASRKCGIVFLLGLTDPLQSRLGIRLSNAANRIAVDCVTSGVSESLMGDASAADPTLRNGRVLVRSPTYNGIGRVFVTSDELSPRP
jgi:FtsK/SpoIIIE family